MSCSKPTSLLAQSDRFNTHVTLYHLSSLLYSLSLLSHFPIWTFEVVCHHVLRFSTRLPHLLRNLIWFNPIHSPPLALRRPSDEAPVHADGLTHELLAVQSLHGSLSFFIRLVFHQGVALREKKTQHRHYDHNNNNYNDNPITVWGQASWLKQTGSVFWFSCKGQQLTYNKHLIKTWHFHFLVNTGDVRKAPLLVSPPFISKLLTSRIHWDIMVVAWHAWSHDQNIKVRKLSERLSCFSKIDLFFPICNCSKKAKTFVRNLKSW